jgi:flagellar FliL protein
MAAKDLDTANGKAKNKKLIIIAVVVVVLAVAAAAFILLNRSGDEAAESPVAAEKTTAAAADTTVDKGSALYVSMPRPFIFNVPGATKDRLVQIKVQLLVRGSSKEEIAKVHIPLIESTLLRNFSNSNAEELITVEGKENLKKKALRDVQEALVGVAGSEVVEEVLFTGFVMQ